MLQQWEEMIKLVDKFNKLAQKHDIWYVLDNTTLLGAVRHGGFIPWKNRFEILMTANSYKKLQKLFPENVIDSSINENLRSLHPLFVENTKDLWNSTPRIEIRILVPTSVKAVKKFASSVSNLVKVSKGIRGDNVKNAIDELDVKRFEGYYIIDKRKADFDKWWFQVFSFERIEAPFLHLTLPIPREYDEVLTSWFGQDYMNSEIVDTLFNPEDPKFDRKVYKYTKLEDTSDQPLIQPNTTRDIRIFKMFKLARETEKIQEENNGLLNEVSSKYSDGKRKKVFKLIKKEEEKEVKEEKTIESKAKKQIKTIKFVKKVQEDSLEHKPTNQDDKLQATLDQTKSTKTLPSDKANKPKQISSTKVVKTVSQKPVSKTDKPKQISSDSKPKSKVKETPSNKKTN